MSDAKYFDLFRNLCEFRPDQFTFENPEFHDTLKSIFENVKGQLQCEADFVLEKLVVCGKGSHFETRTNDCGKNEIGTLIVQLPSLFVGNALIIHHGNETETIEFDQQKSTCGIIYSAFYSSCSDFTL